MRYIRNPYGRWLILRPGKPDITAHDQDDITHRFASLTEFADLFGPDGEHLAYRGIRPEGYAPPDYIRLENVEARPPHPKWSKKMKESGPPPPAEALEPVPETKKRWWETEEAQRLTQALHEARSERQAVETANNGPEATDEPTMWDETIRKSDPPPSGSFQAEFPSEVA